MKSVRLTDSDTRLLQRDPGKLAERLVEENYRYSRFGVDNFDVSEGGTVAEVKSTATRLENDAKGRFRLWEKQHSKLTRFDREGTARYVFVLIDVSGRPLTANMKQQIPSDIGNVIAGRGGFNQSGHSMGPQHKLPYEVVF